MIRTALVRSAIAATAAPRASASTVPGLVRCKHSLPELPYSYDVSDVASRELVAMFGVVDEY